ncbi:MAG: S8 family serine peptidase [Anaerolineae bacterium]|jgi:subtilisin-like proprotein convertase family protein|nr:S8 family serine peptidase [Anaerolineae bacterium]
MNTEPSFTRSTPSQKAMLLTLMLVLLSVLIVMPSSAQFKDTMADPAPLAATPTNFWAVQLAPGTDPNVIAAQMGMVNYGQVGELAGVYLFKREGRSRSVAAQEVTRALRRTPGVTFVQRQRVQPRFTRQSFTDPLYPNQWHLRNTGQGGGRVGEDANVVAAWNNGYDGSGVVVSSVDDGVWITSPDLIPNYSAFGSYDYVGRDGDPSGGSHGTAVAGVMAASENTECGVGAAYNATVTGIRLLGAGTDANEAAALNYQFNFNQIYNNSWGPSDDGQNLTAPGPLTLQALVNGITNGRNGRGSIYVWAAGNGGSTDNVNGDGYANSVNVIAVGASTNTGARSSYSEPGAAMLINAPSNGGTLGITTTDGPGSTGYTTGNCTSTFGGTSSAAPLAAGVIALMLDANPNLTARDVQHILVRSAEKNDPTNADWRINGAGFNINHNFGFGRVDAGAATQLAAGWVTVAPKTTLSSQVFSVNTAIPDGTRSGPGTPVTRSITVSNDLVLEHVEIVFSANHTWRGDLEVTLTSPRGTVSRMIYGRTNDRNDNYVSWRMMTVRNWGERSNGTWTISVRDTARSDVGTFVSWQLILHGTTPTGAAPAFANAPLDVTDLDAPALIPMP